MESFRRLCHWIDPGRPADALTHESEDLPARYISPPRTFGTGMKPCHGVIAAKNGQLPP